MDSQIKLVGFPPRKPIGRSLIGHIAKSVRQMKRPFSTRMDFFLWLARTQLSKNPLRPIFVAVIANGNARIVIRASPSKLPLNLQPGATVRVVQTPRSAVGIPPRRQPIKPKENHGTGGKYKEAT